MNVMWRQVQKEQRAKRKSAPLAEFFYSKPKSPITVTSLPGCVEELVINSVSSSPNCISVRVNVAEAYVQVIDNGVGIDQSTMLKLGERPLPDLNKLHGKPSPWYGHGGSAVLSIIEMSGQVEVISRCNNPADSLTYCKTFKSGLGVGSVTKMSDERPCAGTTITVCNLYHKAPVRKKQLSETRTMNDILLLIQRLAIILAEKISISLRDEAKGKVIINTSKSKTAKDAILDVFGTDYCTSLHTLKGTCGNIRIVGVISTVTYSGKKIKMITINHRQIANTRIQQSIDSQLKYSNIKLSGNSKAGDTEGPSEKMVSKPSHYLYCLDICCSDELYSISRQSGSQISAEFHDWQSLLNAIHKILKKFLQRHKLQKNSKARLDDSKSVSSKPEEGSVKCPVNRSALSELSGNVEKRYIDKRPTSKPVSSHMTGDGNLTQPGDGAGCAEEALVLPNYPATQSQRPHIDTPGRHPQTSAINKRPSPIVRASEGMNLPERRDVTSSHGAHTVPHVVYWLIKYVPEMVPPLEPDIWESGTAPAQLSMYPHPGSTRHNSTRSLSDSGRSMDNYLIRRSIPRPQANSELPCKRQKFSTSLNEGENGKSIFGSKLKIHISRQKRHGRGDILAPRTVQLSVSQPMRQVRSAPSPRYSAERKREMAKHYTRETTTECCGRDKRPSSVTKKIGYPDLSIVDSPFYGSPLVTGTHSRYSLSTPIRTGGNPHQTCQSIGSPFFLDSMPSGTNEVFDNLLGNSLHQFDVNMDEEASDETDIFYDAHRVTNQRSQRRDDVTFCGDFIDEKEGTDLFRVGRECEGINERLFGTAQTSPELMRNPCKPVYGSLHRHHRGPEANVIRAAVKSSEERGFFYPDLHTSLTGLSHVLEDTRGEVSSGAFRGLLEGTTRAHQSPHNVFGDIFSSPFVTEFKGSRQLSWNVKHEDNSCLVKEYSHTFNANGVRSQCVMLISSSNSAQLSKTSKCISDRDEVREVKHTINSVDNGLTLINGESKYVADSSQASLTSSSTVSKFDRGLDKSSKNINALKQNNNSTLNEEEIVMSGNLDFCEESKLHVRLPVNGTINKLERNRNDVSSITEPSSFESSTKWSKKSLRTKNAIVYLNKKRKEKIKAVVSAKCIDIGSSAKRADPIELPLPKCVKDGRHSVVNTAGEAQSLSNRSTDYSLENETENMAGVCRTMTEGVQTNPSILGKCVSGSWSDIAADLFWTPKSRPDAEVETKPARPVESVHSLVSEHLAEQTPQVQDKQVTSSQSELIQHPTNPASETVKSVEPSQTNDNRKCVVKESVTKGVANSEGVRNDQHAAYSLMSSFTSEELRFLNEDYRSKSCCPANVLEKASAVSSIYIDKQTGNTVYLKSQLGESFPKSRFLPKTPQTTGRSNFKRVRTPYTTPKLLPNVDSVFSQSRKENFISFNKEMLVPLMTKRETVLTPDLLVKPDVIGQWGKQIILVVCRPKITNQEILLAVDQHAAHERIRLELLEQKYVDSRSGHLRTCSLSKPISVSLTAELAAFVADTSSRCILKKLGIELRVETDCDDICVISVPTAVSEHCKESHSYLKEFIQSVIIEVMERGCTTVIKPRAFQDAVNSEACRGAIKFGDELTHDQCTSLVDMLSRCRLPFQCAHGRPSCVPIFNMSALMEISQKFDKVKPLNFSRMSLVKKRG